MPRPKWVLVIVLSGILLCSSPATFAQGLIDSTDDLFDSQDHSTTGDGYLGILDVKSGLPAEKLQTDHAAVFYNQGNEQKAKWYGDAFEYAYTQVGADLAAYPAKRFTLYVYLTQTDLVRGLQVFSHFTAEEATYFNFSGMAPRPIEYVMHIAPNFDWHTIAHEYTHTIIEELSGQVYRSIKWLDEGLAEYEAYTTVSKTQYKDSEIRWEAGRMRVVYGALDQGKLFTVSEISSEDDWHKRLPGSPERDLEYAQAYAIVTYLVKTHGFEKCKIILLSMKKGQTQESAVQNALGVTPKQFETRFRNYLPKIMRGDLVLELASVEYPSKVVVGQSLGVTVNIAWSNVKAEQLPARVLIYEGPVRSEISFSEAIADSGADNIQISGTGLRSVAFTLTAPSREGSWQLSAYFVVYAEQQMRWIMSEEMKNQFGVNVIANVMLTVQLDPATANVRILVDGSQKTTDSRGRVQVQISVTAPHVIQVPADVSTGPGTRIVLLKWGDGVTSNSRDLRPTDDTEFTVRYKTQYELTVNSAVGKTEGSGWYDHGSTAIFSVTTPVPVEGFLGAIGVKQVFAAWTGDSSTTRPTAAIAMNRPHTVTATFTTDYMPLYMIVVVVLAIVTVLVLLPTFVFIKRSKSRTYQARI